MVRPSSWILHRFLQIMPGATAGAMGLALLLGFAITATDAQGQTYQVIHRFNYADGDQPEAGLTIDRAGNLYGTAYNGGRYGFGSVYKMTPVGSHWVFSLLYSFAGGSDGAHPFAGALVFGPDGALYGTTYAGGNGGCGNQDFGCGTVFRLTPPANICVAVSCSWSETVLYRFSGGADGGSPYAGVVFDQAGNIYGTTPSGGSTSSCFGGCGVVYELSRSGSGWSQSVIHTFTAGGDGETPYSGLITDQAGNLYGCTALGGSYGQGTVYRVAPSGSGWTETILYNFSGGTDGGQPIANLIFDGSGRLYGAASVGGQSGVKLRQRPARPVRDTGRPPRMLPPIDGTAFRLTPSGNNWNFELLYTFALANDGGEGPVYNFIMDSAMNLYGTVIAGGLPPTYDGAIYKLTPGQPQWTYTALYNFTDDGNGGDSSTTVVFDAQGNLYGTALNAAGVVWELTP